MAFAGLESAHDIAEELLEGFRVLERHQRGGVPDMQMADDILDCPALELGYGGKHRLVRIGKHRRERVALVLEILGFLHHRDCPSWPFCSSSLFASSAGIATGWASNIWP